jgi:peptidoglycan/xylan/chitin deacetylase (PgdA/CDA1 family)
VSLLRKAADAIEVPRDLVLGRYPEFVRGGPLPRGHVPVFVFHSLEEESFGGKLEHLARNHYVTLTADEYFAFVMGTRPVPDRAVVLTFDDGRASLWTVGAPLLRRHRMTGIVFLVPGRMSASSAAPAPPHEGLLSWEQVESLARNGPFDFQSHTHTHACVHVGPRPAGFVTPAARRGYAAFDVPMIHAGGRDLMGEDVPLGTPILESAPRMGDGRRFYEDPSFREAAVRAVAEGGGEAFFARPGWEKELARVTPRRAAGRWETREEATAAIRRELAESKRAIEERTNKPVVHLCHPWHVAGATTLALMRETGYRTAFSGKVRGVPLTPAGGDPYRIARIGEDYVELLPGEGRVSLGEILRRKWRRRMGPPV